ncbi:MAG: hypothetical protein PHV30_07465 [Candidatus Margulisbacteria bacterium]|nr:hypothetical protein [Candidatus Margulisiibacteriota bacterium]
MDPEKINKKIDEFLLKLAEKYLDRRIRLQGRYTAITWNGAYKLINIQLFTYNCSLHNVKTDIEELFAQYLQTIGSQAPSAIKAIEKCASSISFIKDWVAGYITKSKFKLKKIQKIIRTERLLMADANKNILLESGLYLEPFSISVIAANQIDHDTFMLSFINAYENLYRLLIQNYKGFLGALGDEKVGEEGIYLHKSANSDHSNNSFKINFVENFSMAANQPEQKNITNKER